MDMNRELCIVKSIHATSSDFRRIESTLNYDISWYMYEHLWSESEL